MNCVVPLVKTVDCAALQSYTRIPHLRAHIRARRLGITSSNNRPCLRIASGISVVRPLRRNSSTSSPYDILADDDFISNDSAREEANIDVWTIKPKSVDRGTRTQLKADLNAYDGFHEALVEGHPQKVLFALNNTTHGSAFIESADNAAFTQALSRLDPAYFIEPYIQLYRNLDPYLHTDEVRHRQARSLEDRWDKHVVALDGIIARRKQAGHAISLDGYRELLKNAGAMGEELLAIGIFEKLMPEEGVKPDLKCFNYYMQARVWSGWHEARFRGKTRVIRANLNARDHPSGVIGKARLRSWQFQPERSEPTTPKWIRQVILNMFQELNRQGSSGNEETYVNLILAMSQAGDVAGIKSVLKSVWNINVDLLAQYDEEEIESPTYYDEESPLRPTERLLFTLAYTFGNNNDMIAAYQLVDYVSRNYNIPIPEYIWHRLYEMTFVLTRSRSDRKSGYAKRWGYLEGQLGHKSLPDFFSLVTGEPHNIKPSVVMLIMLARLERDKHQLDPYLSYVRQALEVLDEEKTKLSTLYDEVVGMIKTRQAQAGDLSVQFLDKRREFIIKSLHVEKNLQYILTAVSHLLSENEWAGGGKLTDLAHRQIPNLVQEFDTFLPNELNYQLPTGHIDFVNGQHHREYAIQLADDHFHARVGQLRKFIDTDDYNELVTGVTKVPRSLKRRDNWCYWCETRGHNERECTEIEKILALERPFGNLSEESLKQENFWPALREDGV